MTKGQEGKRNPLNNQSKDNSYSMNRGLELLMRNKKRREREPKTFQLKFGKMVSLFRREIHFFLDIQLDFKKVTSRRK
jgi:hypothetical protein